MRNGVTRRRVAVVVISAALVALAGALLSSGAGADNGQHGFDGQPVGHRTDDPSGEHARDVSRPLREIAPIAPAKGQLTVKREYLMRPPATGTGAPDTAVQSSLGAAAAPVLNGSFDGVGQGFTGPAGTFTVNSAPPDTNGQVGPNNYVQIVNSAFAIFDKAGNVHAPIGKVSFPLESLETNFTAFMDQIVRSKPTASKGVYVRTVSLSSTMGPGVAVDTTPYR